MTCHRTLVECGPEAPIVHRGPDRSFNRSVVRFTPWRLDGDPEWRRDGRLWMFRAVEPLSDWYCDFPPATLFRCEVWYDPSRDVASLVRVLDEPPLADLGEAAGGPPPRMQETRFGRMVHDVRLRRWSAPVAWTDEEVILSIDGIPDAPDPGLLDTVAGVLGDAGVLDANARAAFTAELFGLQDEGWSAEPVRREQFASRPRPTNLHVDENEVELWFEDELSFTDHAVRVVVTLDSVVRRVFARGVRASMTPVGVASLGDGVGS